MTKEEKQNIKEQFNDIVNNGIVPILKTAGFKKRGNNFHANTGEIYASPIRLYILCLTTGKRKKHNY